MKPPTRLLLHFLHAASVLPLLALVSCSGDTPSAEANREPPPAAAPLKLLVPPAGPGSMAPQLAPGRDATLLTWLEPVEATDHNRGFRLRIAELRGEEWTSAQEIVTGDAMFANWADVPAVVEGTGGTRFAHWLNALGDGDYAYGVELVRSTGEVWERLGLLHDDATPMEHGFVSYVPLADGSVQAFWLDGRAMPGGEPMQLRTVRLGDAGPPAESTLLDSRVCECCATDAALTAEGPVVAYRDRSDDEIRDIYVVRATGEGWSEPTAVHGDGWQIHGCPVNGPAIAAEGRQIAVAWFTAGEPGARVSVAFSDDTGRSFGEPIVVDDQDPVGRVGLALDARGRAYVSWMGTKEEEAEIRWRQVTDDGGLGDVHTVAESTGLRSAGVPRMLLRDDGLVFAWVEDVRPARLHAGFVALTEGPARP